MHHEQACSIAAEAYARMKKKTLFSLCNYRTRRNKRYKWSFGAYTDSIPMIVISGQVKRY